MRDGGVTESITEQATLAWLESLGWTVKRRQEIAQPKLVAVADHIGAREDHKCYKELKVGSQVLKRYSPKWIKVAHAWLEKSSL